MRLLVVAVGTRMPDWVAGRFAEYARRMPRATPLVLSEIKPEPRGAGRSAAQLCEAEATRIEAVLPTGCRRVMLDERGADVSTAALAQRLAAWRAEGRDVALVIGGPDGLAARLRASADETLRLSSLTLPHALARVVLAEALYRAASVLANHPYHRD